MESIRVYATSDIARPQLETWAREMPAELKLELDQRVAFFRSAAAPSWVTLFAEAPVWLQALGALAAPYGVAILTEAGKETWKNRARLIAGGRDLLYRVTEKLLALKVQLRPETALAVSIPHPNDHHGATLTLTSSTIDDLRAELVLFLLHLPALDALLREEGIYDTSATVVSLRLEDNGWLQVTWMDPETLNHREIFLRGTGGP